MSASDFVKAAKGIDAGGQQAMKARTSLARFSAEPGRFREYLAGHRVARGEVVRMSNLKMRTPEGEFEHALPEAVAFQASHAPPRRADNGGRRRISCRGDSSRVRERSDLAI